MNRGPTMQDAVQRYLRERRLLGFALKSPGAYFGERDRSFRSS